MSQEIQKVENIFSSEDIKLIQNTVARNTTPSEFKLFLYTAKKYNLDPLIKQLWCVKYGNAPATIFTGRDGFLHIAHRTGKFNGMKTLAITTSGKEVPTCLDFKDLAGAICYVYRNDMQEPFVVAVNLNEYNTGKSNWSKMPETMIKKVAESQALRRAFDIIGIYSPEEYDPSIDTPVTLVKSTKPVAKKMNLAKKEPAKEKPKKNAEPNYNILQEFSKLKKFFNTIHNSQLYYKVLKGYDVSHCNELVTGADIECLETLKNALTKAQYSYIEDIASAFEKVNLKNEFVEYTKKYCQQTRVKKILKCKDNLILNNYIKDITKYYEDILSGKNAEPVPDDTEYNDENLPFDEEEGL